MLGFRRAVVYHSRVDPMQRAQASAIGSSLVRQLKMDAGAVLGCCSFVVARCRTETTTMCILYYIYLYFIIILN